MADQSNTLKDTGDNEQVDADVLSVSSDEYIDDETTIAAEEAMEPEMDPNDEIRLLTEDLNVDVEEICSGLGYTRSRRTRQAPSSPTTEPEPKQPSQSPSPSKAFMVPCPREPEQESELTQFYLNKVVQSAQRFSSDEDDEYIPLKQIVSEIRVGSEFQAELKDFIPDSIHQEYEELMWKPPMSLSDSELITYEIAAKEIIQNHSQGGTEPPQVDSDNSLALKCLLEAGYVVKDALQLLRSELSSIIPPMSANVLDDLNAVNNTVIHLKNDSEENLRNQDPPNN